VDAGERVGHLESITGVVLLLAMEPRASCYEKVGESWSCVKSGNYQWRVEASQVSKDGHH